MEFLKGFNSVFSHIFGNFSIYSFGEFVACMVLSILITTMVAVIVWMVVK